MAETEVKDTTTAVEDPPLAQPPSDVALKTPPPPEVPELKPEDSKSLALVEKTPEPIVKKPSGGSIDRDIALAEVEKEKRLSYIKAWEESERTKALNKAQKKLSSVSAWENSKKAAIEAKLKEKEEILEKRKAEYGEKLKNKVAAVHKLAEEKKASVEAIRAEEILKTEEAAAKFRATGTTPKKFLGFF